MGLPQFSILTGHHGTDELFKDIWKEARMGQSQFNIFNFTTEEEREKLCKECRTCCQLSAIPTPFIAGYTNLDEVVEFYQLKGFRTTLINERLYVIVDIPCKNICESGCMIYLNRPNICRVYDGRKDPIVKEQCAWHLAEVEAYNYHMSRDNIKSAKEVKKDG